ncbi:MAG: hypothetical protein QG608_3878 [Actinomycetota bacterium]|nr:hypothetical protein [Actinomycetota bacterium]
MTNATTPPRRSAPRTPEEPLNGRTALVTGGSSGIGAAIAQELAALGAHVAVVARRTDLLDATVSRIRQAGGRALAVAADLTTPTGPQDAVAQVRDLLGPVDILVCAAGAVRLGGVDEVSDRHWNLMFTLNLDAPFRMARAVLPDMRHAGYGWIVAIGSAAGADIVPGSGAYGISKAALNRLVELIDEENRACGVRAVAVCPGWVRTALAQDPAEAGIPEDEVLSPQDVAQTVSWLVTRPSRLRLDRIVRCEPTSPRADATAAMVAALASSGRGRAEEGTPR